MNAVNFGPQGGPTRKTGGNGADKPGVPRDDAPSRDTPRLDLQPAIPSTGRAFERRNQWFRGEGTLRRLGNGDPEPLGPHCFAQYRRPLCHGQSEPEVSSEE